MKYFPRSIAYDFAAPRQDASLGAGSLGFFNLTIPNVKERKARPSELIVRSKLDCFSSRLNRFRIAPVFHQGHSQSVPSIKKVRKLGDALLVFLDGRRKLTDGQIAIGIVKKLFNSGRDFFLWFHGADQSVPLVARTCWRDYPVAP